MPRRYVNFQRGADHECALLGALGFSTTFIQMRTGLSQCQVTYRLHKASIRRLDFRDGQSPIARAFLRNAREVAEPKLIEHLKKHVPAPRVAPANYTNAWGANPRPLAHYSTKRRAA